MMWERIPLPRGRIASAVIVLALLLAAAGMTRLASTLAADPLAALDAARQQRAALTAIAERPPAPAPSLLGNGLTQGPVDRAKAMHAMTATIRKIGARAGVLVESHDPIAADELASPLVAIHLTASAPEKALLTFISDIERARPVMRLTSWKLARADDHDAALRLDARVVTILDNPH